MADPFASESRQTLPFVVLDQNCLRDELIISEAVYQAKKCGRLVVLTETLFQELLKSEQWLSYYRISLSGLTEHPECVVGARSLGELLEGELAGAEPRFDIVSERWTTLLRLHLTNLHTGPDQFMQLNQIFAKRIQEGAYLRRLTTKGLKPSRCGW